MAFASHTSLGEGKCNFECVSNMYLWSVPRKRGNYAGGRERLTDSGEKKRKVILNTDFRSMKNRLKGKQEQKLKENVIVYSAMGKVPINNKVGSPIKVKYNYFVMK